MSLETPKEKVQREREKQEYISSLPLRHDYAATFGTEHGLRVLAHILKQCHINSNPFSNSGWTAFAAGELNVALRFKDYAPEQYKLAHNMIMDEIIDEQKKITASLLDDPDR